MPRTAIYPGTFDPITNGHIDILQRAALRFDAVILAVAGNTAKGTVFDLDERVELATVATADLDNVDVRPFNGLLVEFARTHGAEVILRGLRAVSDFEFEFQLATMNRKLAPEIETLFLTPGEGYTFISSSIVREIAALNGDISSLVPAHVRQALDRRLKNVANPCSQLEPRSWR